MFQARTGRFTQPDPVGAGLFDPQQWNRYAYARNNGARNIDPRGLLVVFSATSNPACETFHCDLQLWLLNQHASGTAGSSVGAGDESGAYDAIPGTSASPTVGTRAGDGTTPAPTPNPKPNPNPNPTPGPNPYPIPPHGFSDYIAFKFKSLIPEVCGGDAFGFVGPTFHPKGVDIEVIIFGGYGASEGVNGGFLAAGGAAGHVAGFEVEYSLSHKRGHMGAVGLGGYGPDHGYAGPIVSVGGGNVSIGGYVGSGLFGGGGSVTIGYNCQ